MSGHTTDAAYLFVIVGLFLMLCSKKIGAHLFFGEAHTLKLHASALQIRESPTF